jgi:uncharacterized protein YfiM (DUF2279 family)
MKRLAYALILVLSVSMRAQSSIPAFFESSDKQLHMGACYVISSVTTATVYKRTGNRRTAVAVGLGTGIAIGVAKELYDIEHGNPEYGDIVADVIGSVAGVLVVRITF